MSVLPTRDALLAYTDEELNTLSQCIGAVRRARQSKDWFVSVEPLQNGYRALVAREGLTAAEVAARLGWKTKGGRSNDGRRVRITIGLCSRSDTREPQARVQRKTAKRLADVFGLDYQDVGL